MQAPTHARQSTEVTLEEITTIFCRPVVQDPRCPDCGRDRRYRDTVTRPLTDLPVAGYPLVLRVAVPRYRCLTLECGRVVFQLRPDAGPDQLCRRGQILRRLRISY